MISIPSGTPLTPVPARIGGVHYFDADGVLRYTPDNTSVPSEFGGFRADPQATNIVPESDYRSLDNWQLVGATILPTLVTLLDTAQAAINTVRESISYGRHGAQYLFSALPNTCYAITLGVRRGAGSRNVALRVTADASTTCTLDLVQPLTTNSSPKLIAGISVHSEQQSLWTVVYAVMRTQSAAQYILELLGCATDRGDTTDYLGDGVSTLEVDWLTIAPSMMPVLPVQGYRTRYTTQYTATLAVASNSYWVSCECVLHYSVASLVEHTLLQLNPIGLSLRLTPVAGVSAAATLRNAASSNYTTTTSISGVVVAHDMVLTYVIAVVGQRATAVVRIGDTVRLLQHLSISSTLPTSAVVGDASSAATYKNLRYGLDALTTEQLLTMVGA